MEKMDNSWYNDPECMFSSSKARDKVNNVSQSFGINAKDVLPMIHKPSNTKNAEELASYNLRYILSMAKDFLELIKCNEHGIWHSPVDAIKNYMSVTMRKG
ncbi:hypothetical protein MHBO_004750, partial [Bonamia ostreae]